MLRRTPSIPPGPSTIDLHCHTLRSDGVLEPVALAAAAAACGVELLAITDHDDLSAYRELASGGTTVPRLLPGVEINCLTGSIPGLWEGELHVLGLGVDPDDEAFEATLAEQRGRRRVRFERTLERLRELGMPVDDCRSPAGPGRDGLARATDRRPAPPGRGLRRERRGRVRPLPRPGQAGLRPSRGDRSDRGDHGDPRRRRPACARPLLRGARTDRSRARAPGCRAGRARGLLPDVRPGHGRGGRHRGRGPRAGRDGRLGLPRRHRPVCRGTRRAVGAARGRRPPGGRPGRGGDGRGEPQSHGARRRPAGAERCSLAGRPTRSTVGSGSTSPRPPACRHSTSGRWAAR